MNDKAPPDTQVLYDYVNARGREWDARWAVFELFKLEAFFSPSSHIYDCAGEAAPAGYKAGIFDAIKVAGECLVVQSVASTPSLTAFVVRSHNTVAFDLWIFQRAASPRETL